MYADSALIVGAVSRGRSSVLFFFFQAEDGIRDLTVTGVQTCALPISYTQSPRWPPGGRVVATRSGKPAMGDNKGHFAPGARRMLVDFAGGDLDALRSEERRVGKECRSRWSPYH